MKVVLAAPYFPQPRGNTVTVKRIASRLQQMEVETEVVSITEEDEPPKAVEEADLVHGFHAFRFYEYLNKTGAKIDNYIISLTGTDLNHDFYNEERKAGVLQILESAKAIHVFTKEAKNTLIKEIPRFQKKTVVIPQGTSDFPDLEAKWKKKPGTFVFLLPAGIRKVKNIPGAIKMLSALHTELPHVRLWIAGPVLETDEGETVKQLAEKHKDWISLFGEVSFAEMGALYQQTDAMINTSHSEGQSSAILEAMDQALPVIVSDNQGNKSIVDHGKTGFIYQSSDEFLDYARQIVNNNELRMKIGRQAQEYIFENHSGKKEADAFYNLYLAILSGLDPL